MLLPTKACFAPGEPVTLEVAPAEQDRRLRVTRLGVEVETSTVVAGRADVILSGLSEGGYGLALLATPEPDAPVVATGAVEVLADPFARMRYGFVANFAPERDIDGVLRNFRRLHLTAAQFYDWAYRHADLVGPDPVWTDPLGQPVSLATVRALAAGFTANGTAPLGYAAVYGVGKHEWPQWEHAALLRPDGTVYTLADFLSIVDPSDPAWLAHFRADLARAVATVGFAGFHLDQYGFPRRAKRRDGTIVDLSVAFDAMIRGVREELPTAKLVFNNVSDFPIWVTTRSPQDATYTEVWEPHDTLADVAAVATRARTLAPDRPAVLAAYQSVFEKAPARQAELATKFTMATLFSHGATQLLAGEANNLLVDPYYVRNYTAEQSTLDMLAEWYDLLVAAGDVLMSPHNADITRSVVGELNGELDVFGRVLISHEPRAGVVWRRVVQTPHGTVVHLINLVGQDETGWDTPKGEPSPLTGLRLRLRRVGTEVPAVLVADPDQGPEFVTVPTTVDGEYIEAELPALSVWQLVLIARSQ